MKIRQLFFLALSLLASSGYSVAGELFITNNINLYTKKTHYLSLKKALQLEDASITSIFVLASTDKRNASFRLLLNEEPIYEHMLGPKLHMLRLDTHFLLKEVDSLLIEFEAGIYAVTVGAILETKEEGMRAITIGEGEEPGDTIELFPEEEVDFLLQELRRVRWDQRKLDLLWYFRNTANGRYFSMRQMARVLRTFFEDAFRMEALRILLFLLEQREEEIAEVIDSFYHPLAKRDAEYLLREYIRNRQ